MPLSRDEHIAYYREYRRRWPTTEQEQLLLAMAGKGPTPEHTHVSRLGLIRRGLTTDMGTITEAGQEMVRAILKRPKRRRRDEADR